MSDAAGNLYGTTFEGGTGANGVIYKLAPQTGGGFQQSVLYNFTGGADGGWPYTTPIFDEAGNLYGTTAAGGNNTSAGCEATAGCGVIFKLAAPVKGKWKFSVVHTFLGGRDGVGPAWLAFNAGTLFAATAGPWGGPEGSSGPGSIFELVPVSGDTWQTKVVHAFTGEADGAYPGSLIFDVAGNMYGTGSGGGLLNNCYNGDEVPVGCGVVFELSPTADGKWKETVLYSFTGYSDGSEPSGGVVFDKTGNLYGVTFQGGNTSLCGGVGCGALFELTPQSGGGWKESVPVAFSGTDGSFPVSNLISDGTGNFYGVTEYGGSGSFGTAFEFIP